jgi:hypothetical protein
MRPAIATVLVGALALTAGTALAVPIIESTAGAETIYYSDVEPYPAITSNEEQEESTQAGERVGAAVPPICPSGCEIDVGPNDPWYEGWGAIAEAQTDYGVNRARAFALFNDNYAGGEPRLDSNAGARSSWQDELTLLPLPPSSPGGDLEIVFHVDADWENFGSFEFIATLSHSGGSFVVEDGAGPTGEEDGSLDYSFSLIAPYLPGVTYALAAELIVWAGSGNESSLVDAFSTAQVTQTRLPPGGGLISAAGALDAYHVVPEPGSGALLAAGVAGLVRLARRRAVARRPE